MRDFSLLAILVSVVSAVVALLSARHARKTFQENRNISYLNFYNIIQKHHSREITDLRRTVRDGFKVVAETARKKGLPIKDIDESMHLEVSTLANYYESLGMFLQGGWHFFPKEVQETMLEMLHNSATEHWSQLAPYKDLIHPRRPNDWAKSFEWLNNKCVAYRKEHKIENADKLVGTSIIFVNSQNKVLLLLRDDKPTIKYPNMWDIPGGNLEASETPQECIKREMKEELGLALEKLDLFECREFNDRIEYTFWREKDIDIASVNLTEGQKIEWFSAEEISGMELAFEFNVTLESFFEQTPFKRTE